MSNFKLFYKLSSIDRDNDIDGISIRKPKPVAVLEENLVSFEVKFSDKINYYKPPKPDVYPLDLNAGFEFLVCRPSNDFKLHLNKVCFYLMNKIELQESDDEENNSCKYAKECYGEGDDKVDCNYEVFCHLGLLRTLMKTPYADRILSLQWSVFATFCNNKLYLINRREHDGMDRNSSYYHKFEQYCFSNDPQVEPDASGPIDDENKLRYIFSTQLKNFKLIYSSQVNGIESIQKLENLKDLEVLKQCRFLQTVLMKLKDKRRSNWKKNHRIFNWWIKAHLTAVDVMYVGCKTPDGFVDEPAQRLLVKHLPQNQRWLPKVCYNFLYNFIEMVIGVMCEVNSPYTCFEFQYDFSTDSINYRIHEGKTEYSFLTEDYIEFLKK